MATLDVRVTPRASADQVGAVIDGVLEIRVMRPPADGEANRAVLKLVAGALRLAPSRLVLIAGQRGRRKRVRIEGIDAPELARRLAAIGSD